MDRFRNRREAGQRLAERLSSYEASTPLVLALPRGGVPVAFEVAEALRAPLDILLVRKIGAPGQPELGIGAIVEGTPPRLVLNEDLVRRVGAGPAYLLAEERRQAEEMDRRRRLYRGDRPLMPVDGRCVILVDDGIATGGTVRAALSALVEMGPSRLVLAVPVAPPDSLAMLRKLADDVVCLVTPTFFQAVGTFYDDFDQTTDSEVLGLLDLAEVRSPGGGGACPWPPRSPPDSR